MTRATRPGTRVRYVACRLAILGAARRAEKDADRAAATSWRGGGRSCHGFGSTRSIDSRPTRGAPRWQTSSEGRSQLLVYHFMFGPDYTAGLSRPARRCSRTGPTASSSTWRTTTSRFRRCRGRRLRRCRRTSGGWAGPFPWAFLPPAATSTPTSTSWFTEEQQRARGSSELQRHDAAGQAEVFELARGAILRPTFRVGRRGSFVAGRVPRQMCVELSDAGATYHRDRPGVNERVRAHTTASSTV